MENLQAKIIATVCLLEKISLGLFVSTFWTINCEIPTSNLKGGALGVDINKNSCNLVILLIDLQRTHEAIARSFGSY